MRIPWKINKIRHTEGSRRGTAGGWKMLKMTKYFGFFGITKKKKSQNPKNAIPGALVSLALCLLALSLLVSLLSPLSSLLLHKRARQKFQRVGGCPGQTQSVFSDFPVGFFTSFAPPATFLLLLLIREIM